MALGSKRPQIARLPTYQQPPSHRLSTVPSESSTQSSEGHSLVFRIGLALLLVLLLIAGVSKLQPPMVVFCPPGFQKTVDCDTEECLKFNECIPCPPNGIVDAEGVLTCETGYKRLGNECVENEEIKMLARDVILHFRDSLQEKLGQAQCGE